MKTRSLLRVLESVRPKRAGARIRGLVAHACILGCGVLSSAAAEPVGPARLEAGRYHLFPRDLIRITVFGEPELNVERRIDGNGTVSLPLVGEVAMQGLTVAAAEDTIRKLYIDKKIFVRLQVAVSVVQYVPREVSVIGQVKDPGRVPLPIETDSIDIVEAIAKAGGITRLGKPDSVRVTRKGTNGAERTFTVDVQRMFNGRGGIPVFLILPGDVVYIPERIL